MGWGGGDAYSYVSNGVKLSWDGTERVCAFLGALINLGSCTVS